MNRHFLSLLALSFTASLSACAMAGELPDDAVEGESSELRIDPYGDCEETLFRDAEDDCPPLGEERRDGERGEGADGKCESGDALTREQAEEQARAVAFCMELLERENAGDDTRLADPSLENAAENRGDEDPTAPVVRGTGPGHGATHVTLKPVGDARKVY